MSSAPRDRADDGFDGPDGSGWREPEHLGDGALQPSDDPRPPTPPPVTPPPETPPPATPGLGAPGAVQPGVPQQSGSWEPAGWSLPSAEPERPAGYQPAPWGLPAPVPPAQAPSTPVPPDQAQDRDRWAPDGQAPDGQGSDGQASDGQASDQQAPGDRGDGRSWRDALAGGVGPQRGRRPDRVGDQVFRYQGDLIGAQGWGMENGWVPTDGTGPQDAVLAELVASSPVRPTKDDRPANVLRGWWGNLELVAFDVVYTSGRYAQPRWAVTAAPVLGALPSFRLAPARFWKHRVGGLLHLPSGDPEFDARWVLLAAEDTPQLRHVVGDVLVRQLLLGSDDGDEFWSAAGHVAAVRPDGHRPELIEHQGRILAALVGALAVIR